MRPFIGLPRPVRAVCLWAGVTVLLGVACGGNGTPSTSVDVGMADWEMAVSVSEAPAGEVTFRVSNEDEVAHELVVIKNDLPPDRLPTTEGAANEAILNVKGRLEPIPPGEEGRLSLELTPGKYVLICNIVDEASGAAHYRQGMHAAFLVQP